MDRLENYYTQRVSQSDNLLYQVGKTVDGEPVSAAQLDLITGAIRQGLQLSPDDALVDFGCGNGLLTNVIAPQVKSIVGVERNLALYEQACRYIRQPNASFVQADVLRADVSLLAFDKAYSYEVVQHFSYGELVAFVTRVM